MQKLDLRIKLTKLFILEADFSLVDEYLRDDLSLFIEILFLGRRIDLHLLDQISQKQEKVDVDSGVIVFL